MRSRIAAILLVLILGPTMVVGCGADEAAETSQDAVIEEADEASVEPSEGVPVEPAESEMTFSQKQAVSMTEDYLLRSSLSRQGFIDHLVDQGYDEADATFAVDHVDPDWNAQAAKRAEEHLGSSSLSRQELIDQLLLDGFTEDQAENGVSAVGY